MQRFERPVGILDDAEAGAHLVGPVLKLSIHALLGLFKTGIAIHAAGIGSKMSAQCAAPAPAGAVRAAVKAATSVEYHLHHLGGVDLGGVVPAVTVIRTGQRYITLHACTFLEIVLAVVRIVVRVIGRNAVGVVRTEIALECGHVLGIALIAGAKVAKIEVFHCTVLHKCSCRSANGGALSLAVLLLSTFAVP